MRYRLVKCQSIDSQDVITMTIPLLLKETNIHFRNIYNNTIKDPIGNNPTHNHNGPFSHNATTTSHHPLSGSHGNPHTDNTHHTMGQTSHDHHHGITGNQDHHHTLGNNTHTGPTHSSEPTGFSHIDRGLQGDLDSRIHDTSSTQSEYGSVSSSDSDRPVADKDAFMKSSDHKHFKKHNNLAERAKELDEEMKMKQRQGRKLSGDEKLIKIGDNKEMRIE
ncbi:hypothetical protein BDB01DRAFT_263961 [Pilobolus umbonatus]|nr:hypothetical protein BDB01DRAFT_263961 [Pilobolus umbonatus]